MNRRSFIKLFSGAIALATSGASLLSNGGWVKVKSHVIPTTKKLKVIWTPEAEQELQCFYNIKAEEELKRVLTEYIDKDIRKEMLEFHHSA